MCIGPTNLSPYLLVVQKASRPFSAPRAGDGKRTVAKPSWTFPRPGPPSHLNLKPSATARRLRKARSLATDEAIFKRPGPS